jgi:hypothetical protein
MQYTVFSLSEGIIRILASDQKVIAMVNVVKELKRIRNVVTICSTMDGWNTFTYIS